MTGTELFEKLKSMTPEERDRVIIVEDYSGCTAQFLTLENISLANKRIDPDNDPNKVLGEDYISIKASDCYFLG